MIEGVPGELDVEPDVEFDPLEDEDPAEDEELAPPAVALVEVELPLAPVEVAEASEAGESTTLEPATLVLPHPQPHRATVTSTKKSRKNGELCG